jgi:hypothetical protein
VPDAAEAAERLRRHGVFGSSFTFAQVYGAPAQVYGAPAPADGVRARLGHRVRQVGRYLSDRLLDGASLDGTKYPLARSYCDVLAISTVSIKRFCHYCGIFAAPSLFAELAIPTALVLAADKIVTEQDLALRGKALWTQEQLDELNPYGRRLGRLLRGFPADYLYLHPVKLSQWTVEDL